MKALSNMSPTDKASLVHQLFPLEIPRLLDFIEGMAEAMQQNHDRIKENWDNKSLDFSFWLESARQVEYKITNQKATFISSDQNFSNQLFCDDLIPFLSHCLSAYTQTRRHNNLQFSAIVGVLFGFIK